MDGEEEVEMAQGARVMFLISGGLWAIIGFLTAVLQDRGVGPTFVFVSPRTDSALYGAPAEQVLETNDALTTFRFTAIRVIGGLLLAAGALTTGLAWFGLRDQQAWALAMLTVVGLAVVPYWWTSLAPYRAASVPLRLGDLPPFMWVPAALMPVASVLGWIEQIRG